MIAGKPWKPTGAELLGAATVSFLASIIVVAYFIDRAGFTVAPVAVLLAAIVSALGMFAWLRPSVEGGAGELAAFAAVTGVVLTWLLWLSWPDLLPPGGGADLAHHLQLVDFIDRHRGLVHDPTVEWYLGEMVHYTPGAHLLASIAGRLAGTDGFHAIYPVIALAVAIKTGFVFLIALRTVRPSAGTAAVPLALAAVLLLFLPRAFFVGSFVRYSYVAQVVSELFAVVMWWALVVWDQHPSQESLGVFALAGVAAFLTWPIWIGPPLVVLALVVATRADSSFPSKLQTLIVGALPIAMVAAIYASGRLGWAKIVRTGANMPLPAWSDFTWWLLGLSVAGVIAMIVTRRGRVTAWLLGASAVQASALFAIAKASGAVVPYMAIKMAYFVIYPLAVAAAVAIALMWQAAIRATARARTASWPAWTVVMVLGFFIARQTVRMPMQKPMVSESLYRAGEWAREHVDPGCVDYIVSTENTAYWLHLSVLGNRRMSVRTADDSTFIARDAILRWINRGGLPSAIADLGTVPRDVLDNTDELVRFGSAVVIKRRGESTCPQ